MEKENAYMQRMIDWKRVWMLLSKKIWIVVVAIIAGAVIGGLGYKLVDTITSEGQYYRVSSDYYITFNEDEKPSDPLAQEVINWMNKAEVSTIPWNFTVFPSQTFKSDFGAALLQYAQGTKEWDAVKKLFVEQWKTESQ